MKCHRRFGHQEFGLGPHGCGPFPYGFGPRHHGFGPGHHRFGPGHHGHHGFELGHHHFGLGRHGHRGFGPSHHGHHGFGPGHHGHHGFGPKHHGRHGGRRHRGHHGPHRHGFWGNINPFVVDNCDFEGFCECDRPLQREELVSIIEALAVKTPSGSSPQPTAPATPAAEPTASTSAPGQAN